jgi:hypothetical protein
MKFPEKKTLFKTTVLTIVLSCIGFALLELNLVPYGFTLFCVMPILIGYIIGQYPNLQISLFFGAILGVVCFFYLLYIGGLESMFCIITLSPLLILLLFIGMYIGYVIKKSEKNNGNKNSRSPKVYIFPIIILFLSGAIEKFFTEKYTEVTIETKITLPYSKEIVFDYIKSFDTLNSEKPFLFKIGIQTPLKCVLEKDSIGAKRTCYFKEGTIDEIITGYKRGEVLQMKITKYNMPGRKWLHFQDAIYLFKQTGDSTELTRITTYKTELKPRFYWKFWEEKAIRAEHEYVLTDLKRRLNEESRHSNQ